MLLRVATGLLLSTLIAGFAFRRGSLSGSGAATALLVGSAIYVGGGPAWFLALGVFFATSTALGRVGRERKRRLTLEYEKGDTRDGWQVLANGGVAAACAVLVGVTGSPAFAAAFLGALATANGDTWATELGVLSSGEPVSLRSLSRVPRGTSGAVSMAGLLATIAGAATIGLVAALTAEAFRRSPLRALLVATLAGTAGSLVDSYLGATIQAGYVCDACAKETEGPRHHCGRTTRHARGLRAFGNDAVNALATLAGALIAALG